MKVQSNYLTDSEVNAFLECCHNICEYRKYAFFLDGDDPARKKYDERKFKDGILAGLYSEQNPSLMNLLRKPCDHIELQRLLEHYRDEQQNSYLTLLAKKYDDSHIIPEVKEPLIDWIYEVNYLLAYPIAGGYVYENEKAFYANPEKTLTFVYLYLKHKEYEKEHSHSIFEQENIKRIYSSVFDKNSSYKKYGLIPVDNMRELHTCADPVRIYDQEINKTVFLQTPRPLAMVFQKLIDGKYIDQIAFRGDDQFIYDGENHHSSLMEAVEAGKIFDLDIASLPEMSKLVSDSRYDDSLWITVDEANITFEELCDNINVEDDSIVTQVVHLQYRDMTITHIDHEYVFYSLEEYGERQHVRKKGGAAKRFKTFKVDNSSIPFNYDCLMLSLDGKEILVPFIYFVLNTYFVHKDLLKEYFQKILKK